VIHQQEEHIESVMEMVLASTRDQLEAIAEEWLALFDVYIQGDGRPCEIAGIG
jgi:hypothetical protein